MNWLVLMFSGGVVASVWAFWRDSDALPVAVVGTLLAGLFGLIAALQVWNFAPEMAELAQVRSAVERLGCSASEDVLGTATNWNTAIASRRLWNRRWIGDPFVNDGIDTVTMVIIPECK